MKKWLLVGLLCFASLAAAVGLIVLSLPFTNTMAVAEYDHMIAELASQRVKAVAVGKSLGHLGGPAPVYVRLGPTRVARLDALTREEAELLPLERSLPDDFDGITRHYYGRGSTLIVFEEDELSTANIAEYSPIDLAPSPRGPWFRLPIAQEQLIELFGEPVRWVRTPVINL